MNRSKTLRRVCEGGSAGLCARGLQLAMFVHLAQVYSPASTGFKAVIAVPSRNEIFLRFSAAMLAAALTRLAAAHSTDRITSTGYRCSSSSGHSVDHLHAPNAAVVPLPELLLPPLTFGSKQKPFFLLSTQLVTSLGPGLHDHPS